MSYHEKRNEIIIAEIQHWKRNKLLPEIYCDFLLTLYTKGDGSAYQEENNSGKTLGRQWLKLLMFIFIVPVVLVLYLTLNSFFLVFALFLLAMLSFLLYQSIHKNGYMLISHLALVVLLFIVLLLTISFSKLLGNQYITNIVIFINFISWFIFAFKKRYTYLLILSLLAIVFLLIYLVL